MKVIPIRKSLDVILHCNEDGVGLEFPADGVERWFDPDSVDEFAWELMQRAEASRRMRKWADEHGA